MEGEIQLPCNAGQSGKTPRVRLQDYVAAGYFLSRHVQPTASEVPLRLISMAGDHSPRRFFPDAWARSWGGEAREIQIGEADAFSIPESGIDHVVALADQAFGSIFGAWSTFFTLDGARTAARRFLVNAVALDLWGVGLHRDLVPRYCAASRPPAPSPGCAPMGASGIHVAACERGAPLAKGGVALGHEILVADAGNGFNSPESLHLDEAGLLRAKGVRPNDVGLLDSLDEARLVCKDMISTGAAGWLRGSSSGTSSDLDAWPHLTESRMSTASRLPSARGPDRGSGSDPPPERAK